MSLNLNLSSDETINFSEICEIVAEETVEESETYNHSVSNETALISELPNIVKNDNLIVALG